MLSTLAPIGFYAATIALSFIGLMGLAAPLISIHEAALGAIALGTVGGSWLVFLSACITGSLK